MRKTTAVIALVTVLGLLLAFLVQKPPVFCDLELPEGYSEAIRDQARGLYSQRLPLVPVFVNVESIQEQTVQYTVYYFPFGSVGMSYHPADGYNIEKPLVGM